jgi:hypothetical protein
MTKGFFKKYFSRKVLLGYVYSIFSGRMFGFIVGMWATTIVSHFFETRSFHNLWGITSKKTVVDKDTFAHLEWVASVIIGFFVFEVVHKIVKEKVSNHVPEYYKKIKLSIKERGIKETSRLCLNKSYEHLLTYEFVKNKIHPMALQVKNKLNSKN